MLQSSASIEKALGIKNLYKPGLSRKLKPEFPQHKKQPKREPITREDRQKQAKVDASEQQKRLYDRYVARQRARLERLYRDHKPVRRFIKTLWSTADSVRYCGHRDCDIALDELVRDVGLDTCGIEAYDRLLILEHTIDWLWEIAKKQRIKREEFDDDGLWFEPSPPNAISELKRELRL